MTRKVNLLPESDIQEVLRFQQHCADKEVMGKAEFYRKYQEYMGLSDAELEAILRGETPARLR